MRMMWPCGEIVKPLHNRDAAIHKHDAPASGRR